MIGGSELNKIPNHLAEAIQWLSEFGNEEGGGVTRTLYSHPWKEAQEGLKFWMEQLGFHPYYDPIGNLFGRLSSAEKDAPVILVGSHVDTVKSGGKYDGAYGIIAGILALKYLKQKYGTPKRHIEVVSLCEEEGSRFPLTCSGSGMITGAYTIESFLGLKGFDGVTFEAAMMEAGLGPFNQPYTVRGDIRAFVELHIEQGPVLEKLQKSIGIVETIVGQKRFRVTVEGESNHAGTTLIKWRKDAVRGAVSMIDLLYSYEKKYDEHLVTTVGQLFVEPNVPNVIAGRVVFSVDARHPSESILHSFCQQFMDGFNQIAKKMGLTVYVEQCHEVHPVHMDSGLQNIVKEICTRNHIPFYRMNSGAGHDAQLFAPFCPTVLFFVPSRDGISHSPLEYTSDQDLETGFHVLTQVLHHLAYE
jgi:allantoate deiminase